MASCGLRARDVVQLVADTAGLVVGPPDGEAVERLEARLLGDRLALVVAQESTVMPCARIFAACRAVSTASAVMPSAVCRMSTSSSPWVASPKSAAEPSTTYMSSFSRFGEAAEGGRRQRADDRDERNEHAQGPSLASHADLPRHG